MMPILIQGPRQPGNDIDVYLKPLVEELLVLWNKPGVRVWDEYKQEHFRRLQTSFRNPRLSQIEKFLIPSLLNSKISTIVVLVNFPFEKVWTVQICDF